jgi:hypothetical protein
MFLIVRLFPALLRRGGDFALHVEQAHLFPWYYAR